MKIIVLIKETFATDSRMTLTNAGEIESSQRKYIINPYDEYALEEAVLIKEQYGGEIVVYILGREESVLNIKTALAIGADRAVLIKSTVKDSINTSKTLAACITSFDGDFDLILAGWVAVDDNNAQVPARISQLLKVPLVNVVTGLSLNLDSGKALCRRESESRQETVEVTIPALIAVHKGINEPRYPTVRNIMQAKEKEIKIHTPDAMENITGVSLTYHLPAKTKTGYIIDGSDPLQAVTELIAKILEAKAL